MRRAHLVDGIPASADDLQQTLESLVAAIDAIAATAKSGDGSACDVVNGLTVDLGNSLVTAGAFFAPGGRYSVLGDDTSIDLASVTRPGSGMEAWLLISASVSSVLTGEVTALDLTTHHRFVDDEVSLHLTEGTAATTGNGVKPMLPGGHIALGDVLVDNATAWGSLTVDTGRRRNCGGTATLTLLETAQQIILLAPGTTPTAMVSQLLTSFSAASASEMAATIIHASVYPSLTLAQFGAAMLGGYDTTTSMQMAELILESFPLTTLAQMAVALLGVYPTTTIAEMGTLLVGVYPTATITAVAAALITAFSATTITQMGTALLAVFPTATITQIAPALLATYTATTLAQMAVALLTPFPSTTLTQMVAALLAVYTSATVAQMASAIAGAYSSATATQVAVALTASYLTVTASALASAILGAFSGTTLSQMASVLLAALSTITATQLAVALLATYPSTTASAMATALLTAIPTLNIVTMAVAITTAYAATMTATALDTLLVAQYSSATLPELGEAIVTAQPTGILTGVVAGQPYTNNFIGQFSTSAPNAEEDDVTITFPSAPTSRVVVNYNLAYISAANVWAGILTDQYWMQSISSLPLTFNSTPYNTHASDGYTSLTGSVLTITEDRQGTIIDMPIWGGWGW